MATDEARALSYNLDDLWVRVRPCAEALVGDELRDLGAWTNPLNLRTQQLPQLQALSVQRNRLEGEYPTQALGS